MERTAVSIIIPTKNSERTIQRLMRSISSQTFKPIETIIVDNDSSDKTREIVNRYAKVHLLREERSSARNFGARTAAGKYLLFLDSDLELTPDVVEKCVSLAVAANVHAIVVPQISVGEGFWGKCKVLEKSCYDGDSTMEAASFFERHLFLKLGGYDELIEAGGEDWDLSLRIKAAGCAIARIDAHAIHHEGCPTIRHLISKKFYYGKKLPRYIVKHPRMSVLQFSVLRPAFVRNWRRVWSSPSVGAGMLLMKFLEHFAGLLGMIVGCLEREAS